MSLFVNNLNGPYEDTLLVVRHTDLAGLVLLDCGLFGHLPRLRKIKRVAITHAHFDHIVGFDILLRNLHAEAQTLEVYGPAETLRCVSNKLRGYLWNIPDEGLEVLVHEVEGRVRRTARFLRRDGFQQDGEVVETPFEGELFDEGAYRVLTEELDHGCPVLAFRLEEREALNVNPDLLARRGLPTGPWLSELKRLMREGRPPETPVEVPGVGPRPLGELEECVLRRPGWVAAYVTDADCSPENEEKIRRLARGADILFIEAVFLDEDRELARRARHLTAREAGRLAREAGAKKVVPVHFSQRYKPLDPLGEALRKELEEAFAGR